MLPSIAQLVERRTVVLSSMDILRSLVRLRLEGKEEYFGGCNHLVSLALPISHIVLSVLGYFSPDLTLLQRWCCYLENGPVGYGFQKRGSEH